VRAEASRLRAPSSNPPTSDEEDDDSGDPDDARVDTGLTIADDAPLGAADATVGSGASGEEDSDDEDDDDED
jgi:hypothetical protein